MKYSQLFIPTVKEVPAEAEIASHQLMIRAGFIRKVAQSEEEGFRATLTQGLRLLDEEFERMKTESSTVVSGAATFKLHDTYGFPTDLTNSIASERGFSVDFLGYEQLMEEQRHRAEWKGSGEEALAPVHKELRAALGPFFRLFNRTFQAGTNVYTRLVGLLLRDRKSVV